MRLELSPLALTDLEAIGDYIALDSPGNALRFTQGLRDQCQKDCACAAGLRGTARAG